ncbi:hypothetical protein R4K54_06050 [Brachyspira murdochii]|uniref:Lipoprotein n=1 Tax=Brachyspira murdochii (strain ATCC 51284 / DSM 12563 / 56-150) TaxID=526224 RepID=D5U610_BRAM5|nr:hypothetical protein [Brachyspira murdochii]ADG70501.1 conserved hypothetical protein [Brachyspira murdochii DSM 12563]
MIRIFISLITCAFLFAISCSNNENKKTQNNNTSESVLDYMQMDSPNSFIPLGIKILAPENSLNAKYFIINKDIAEIDFDYMDNSYIYRASKNSNSLLSFYGDYTNSGKNFIEDDINVEYNISSSGEKFTLWRVNDIYYILSSKAVDDTDLTNLSSIYIKFINNK